MYDPACGTCGFLAKAYEQMHAQEQTHKDYETLQRQTCFGQGKKSVPALLGLMNMVLHNVMTPQVRRRNTLEENIRNVSERFDVILTNPPFGGTENTQIQQNFPVKVNATELLLVEHIMKKLKAREGSPIADEHFDEACQVWNRWQAYRKGQATRPETTDASWIEIVETLAEHGYDLSAKNPSRSEGEYLPLPAELTAMLLERGREFHSIVERLHVMVANGEEA